MTERTILTEETRASETHQQIQSMGRNYATAFVDQSLRVVVEPETTQWECKRCVNVFMNPRAMHCMNCAGPRVEVETGGSRGAE